MQKMVECYLGSQLITIVPAESVEDQRRYFEKLGKGQDFIAKTPQTKENQEKQVAALAKLIKKI